MSETPTAQELLTVRDLHVWFPIRRGILSRTVGHLKAVDRVSLTVGRGETLGLVGESGCGKTTLGRAIVGLEKPRAGAIVFRPQNAAAPIDLAPLPESARRPYRRHLQMIFQDPFASLNPRLTVLDLVTEGLRYHGLIRESPAADAVFWLREVGLDADALYRYPHEFSGGQRQRLSVARAICLQPEFIVCDEAVSALDVSVQAQVINLLADLSRKYQLSYLFISHDLKVVRHLAQRVAVMYLGRIVETGPTRAVIDRPLHPYTQALVSAVPVPGVVKKARIVLVGDVPSPANPPPGCPFHPRCPAAKPLCRTQPPRTVKVDGRQVTCHLHDPDVKLE